MKTPTFEQYLSENTKDHQIRGICQICGREQAVRPNGTIAHHGYTIRDGWFDGTCPGQQHKPLQVDKSETERQIKLITAELPEIEKRIQKIQAGKLRPAHIPSGRSIRRNPILIKWEDADEFQRDLGLKLMLRNETQRLKMGRDTITILKSLITSFYGKEFRKVERVKAADKPKIEVGSRVKVIGKEVTVTKMEYATARGVGPGINGQHVMHVFWEENGQERKYPSRYARIVK